MKKIIKKNLIKLVYGMMANQPKRLQFEKTGSTQLSICLNFFFLLIPQKLAACARRV